MNKFVYIVFANAVLYLAWAVVGGSLDPSDWLVSEGDSAIARLLMVFAHVYLSYGVHLYFRNKEK